jgi:hypothetical protein
MTGSGQWREPQREPNHSEGREEQRRKRGEEKQVGVVTGEASGEKALDSHGQRGQPTARG